MDPNIGRELHKAPICMGPNIKISMGPSGSLLERIVLTVVLLFAAEFLFLWRQVAIQGDPMSLRKNRPKCSPNFLPKFILKLKRFTTSVI
jgi:hypothetical protein